jgi:hypothetical protein
MTLRHPEPSAGASESSAALSGESATRSVARPLEVKPGNVEWRLGVQLDFVTGTCAELSSAQAKSPSHLLVTFHVPNGLTEREIVPTRQVQALPATDARVLGLSATEIVVPHAVRSPGQCSG